MTRGDKVISFCGLTFHKKENVKARKGEDIYHLCGAPALWVKRYITHTSYSLFRFIPVYFQFRNQFTKQGKICEWLCRVIPGRRRRRKYTSSLCDFLFHREDYKIKLDDKNFSPFVFDDEILLKELRELGTFTYIPNPGNMGDCLIAKATYDFFDHNNLSYRVYSGMCADTIVYGGGGIWVKNLYAKSYTKFLAVMKQAKKVVILPCSVSECQDLVDILNERFVVFCRDKRTYDYLEAQKTKAKILMSHDMALRMTDNALQGEVHASYERYQSLLSMNETLSKLGRVAYFFRNDVEQKYNFSSDFDLSAQIGSKKMGKEEVSYAAKVMLSAVDMFDVIVTDRLHVGIAATLMGKEVYLFDNSYGKLSGVYKNSLFSRSNVHLCLDLPSDIPAVKTATDNLTRLIVGMETTVVKE